MSDRESSYLSLPVTPVAMRDAHIQAHDAGGLAPESAAHIAARDPVDRVACSVADGSCASAHAGILNRSLHWDGASTRQSLLRLQSRYGNQYVGRVLRQAADRGAVGPDMHAVERSIDTARGGGQPMDHRTRSQMETAFGANFSGVRIHADAQADALSVALSARAFATGHDVFFRHGEYNPGSSSGRELLAHELTHVVQQTGDGIHRKMTVSQPNDPQEIEADRMARAVIQQEAHGLTRTESEDKDKTVAPKSDASTVSRQPEAPRNEEEEKSSGGG